MRGSRLGLRITGKGGKAKSNRLRRLSCLSVSAFTFSLFCEFSHEERESVDVLQSDTGALGHAVERLRRCGTVCLSFRESPCESAQQCAASAEIDTVLHDVGIEFRRCVLKSREHGVLYLRHGLVETVGYLLDSTRALPRGVVMRLGPCTTKSSVRRRRVP